MSGWLPPWYFDGMAAIQTLASSGEPFTIDDVVAICGEPSNPNMKGRLLTMAQRARLIKRTGNSPQSRSATRRGARIQEWVGYNAPVPTPVENPPAQPQLLEVTR